MVVVKILVAVLLGCSCWHCYVWWGKGHTHTPVSRKVFQYFHCHNIAGKKLLRADYDIKCTSTEYYAFLPLVLAVLLSYTIALPLVISSYLYRHRNKLYTTETHQRIGWLYDPFVRGAEFWQVHDLLMKMLLTVS